MAILAPLCNSGLNHGSLSVVVIVRSGAPEGSAIGREHLHRTRPFGKYLDSSVWGMPCHTSTWRTITN